MSERRPHTVPPARSVSRTNNAAEQARERLNRALDEAADDVRAGRLFTRSESRARAGQRRRELEDAVRAGRLKP